MNERTLTGIDGENVGMGRFPLQIAGCIAEDEFDLIRKRTWFEFGIALADVWAVWR